MGSLYEKLIEFSEINEQFRIIFELTQNRKDKNVEEKEYILVNYIAKEIIVNPQYFNETIKFFPTELPKLLSIAIQFDNEYEYSFHRHILNCLVLGNIINRRSDLKGYALKYFNYYPSPFILDSEIAPLKKRKIKDRINVTDLQLVQTCLILLKSDTDFYRTKWQWSGFINRFLYNTDQKVRGVACRTLAVLFGMNEKTAETILLKIAPNELYSGLSKNLCTNSPTNIDRNPVLSCKQKIFNEIVNICGIYVPSVSKPLLTNFVVEVASLKSNLRKIAFGLMSDKAICLQGPVGSGKTSLVEYLAAKTGRKLGQNFIKIQLGDQTDSKMLLGTYRCTDVPGEFIWQPGVLTQAVIEGNWLLLEDIDSASMDIASVLMSLLENKSLAVPGYRDSVQVSPNFQLFLTQRLITTITGHHKKHSNALLLLEKHLLQVNIDPLTSEELQEILNVRYPKFKTILERMLNVFYLFSRDKQDTSLMTIQKNSRLISTRDFFKWCSRAALDFDVKSQESALKVLQDAIDVFCCPFSNKEEALSLAKEICTQLGIINQKAEFFFTTFKPNIQLTTDSLIVGRAKLKRENNTYSKQVNFSFTRPTAVLLERIMCCVHLNEPVLLVGETGTGKTSSVQYLAHTIGQKLVVINMNQQSDSADLLGGFKPVDMKFILEPLRREFELVFCDYFKIEPNKKYLSNIALCFNHHRWNDLLKLMQKSYYAAISRLTNEIEHFTAGEKIDIDKYKKDQAFLSRWKLIGEKIHKVDLQLKQKNALAFAFIEGSLVKAVENGYWVLLDEINLANAETLECLSGLLEGREGSLCLLERGDKQPVNRHPNFTLFACMNPSTDVGKKDLPAGLRNRFTEFFVEELIAKNDLLLLVNNYLQAMSLKERDLNKIVDFYLKVRNETVTTLTDGLGHKPHYSLRSLCRALSIASKNPCGMFKRSLYEAFCLSFLTQLDSSSYKIVENLISSYLLGDQKAANAVMKQPIPEPKVAKENFVQFEGYWVTQGDLDLNVPEDYILTESVRRNLKDLVRVVSIGKLPVLLQGDTSVGKTSLITYLAKASGNKCVRINNHEHTDLQEYIGSYVADTSGKLVFRDGLLVEAMRKGHWIILDELNLAPTDVLEALNRVLDDNRELFIPETQQTVKANANFMLFATQNPPGAYGGRKMLSRAFRNRFVELHFNEIPPKEVEFILHKRCQVPPSYSKKMINVMTDLQMRRKGSAAFAGKQGFMTLRDLFRWGERYRLAQNTNKLYDWDQHLADEGYLVLAGRVRRIEERNEIREVLNKQLKRVVCPENLFTLSDKTSVVTKHILEKIDTNSNKHNNIVWTYNMRQLAVLVGKAMEFKEPVLLVGETGGGKTTVCKLLAENNGQDLVTVNCHMHTESSDFIGGLRPVRDRSDSEGTKLFEWVDGPLLHAMRNGSVFLADEISLADDSVLERLNSLLEPERSLLLAEKGIDLNNRDNAELIVAHTNFYFIGTMNPGGDFGKKELSPALRNRFTEIWCEPCIERADLVAIISQNLKENIDSVQANTREIIANFMMDFIEWFKGTDIGKRFTISIRDILTWVIFINSIHLDINICASYIHGAYLTFLDSLGSGATSNESLNNLITFVSECHTFLVEQLLTIPFVSENMIPDMKPSSLTLTVVKDRFGIAPFFIEMGNEDVIGTHFSFNAPTTVFNTMRLIRGMQLNKAILLEGSPGVGKTSLVISLARHTRNKIFRINLSDQTDISDLFGADLPVEGGTGGQFSWRDGPLLQALKDGSWILLDELNLASQSVLEGLNACLDHRGEIFIPELGKTFHVKPGTRFFGCQNPLKQGGSRRGLPKSFLNRFIQVSVNSLTDADYIYILTNQLPELPTEIIHKMVEFNTKISTGLESHNFGTRGGPWECNLRDLTRWCEVTLFRFKNDQAKEKKYEPARTVQLIYADRMRSSLDKQKIIDTFENIFECKLAGNNPVAYVNKDRVYLGDVSIERSAKGVNANVLKQDRTCLVLRTQLRVLRSLVYCVSLNWMSIVVGGSGSGKSSVVKTLASLAGKRLKTFPVTSAMDTTDILGGYEQTDYNRHLDEMARETRRLLFASVQELLVAEKIEEVIKLLQLWEAYLEVDESKIQTMEEESKLFLRKLSKLNLLLSELEAKDEVSILQQKAEQISRAVEKEGTLNAGGKFEWVDSVLIKCLQDGSWLLVDNVNLCSSAVLDRLNGLLEPNGVLTISERGVSKDGQMIEVKPHPDFRLFLTMDPKNGEISRAMRNRGVEIFLLSDNETYFSNDFDVKSLINLEGLSHSMHIESMQILHQFMADLILGEKPGVTELLQCSSSIAQQLNHGVDPGQAFFDSIVEIYYKTRSCADFNDNGDILNRIRDEVNRVLSNNKKAICFHKHVTLHTNNIEDSSDIEKIKQQGAMIELFKKNEERGSLILTNLLFNYLAITSQEDYKCRLIYLRNIAPDILKGDTLNLVHPSFIKVCPNLPVDPRWAPELPYTVKRAGWSNMVLLLLNIKNLETKYKMDTPNCVSLYELLQLVKQKKVESTFDHVVTTNFLELEKEFLEFTHDVCRSGINLSDEEVFSIIHLLQWKKYLYWLIETSDIKNIDQLSSYMLKNKLTICYRWFYTHSVQQISEISATKIHPKLQKVLANINAEVNLKFSLMHKLCENYQKACEKPPPFKSQEHREFYESCRKANDQFDICSNQNDVVTVINTFKEKPELRSILCQIKMKEIDCHMLGTIGDISNWNCDTNNFKGTLSKYHLQLIPLIDYYSKLMLKRIIGSSKSTSPLFNCLTIPTGLLSILQRYEQSQDNKLMYEILTIYHQYIHSCPSTKPSKFLFGPEIEQSNVELNEYSPLVTYVTTSLLIKLDSTGITTLGNFRSVNKQHRHLGLLLWRNLYQIHHKEYNSFNLEFSILKRSLAIFCDEMMKSLKIDYSQSSPSEGLSLIEDAVKEFKISSSLQDVNKETDDFISRISLLHTLIEDTTVKVENSEYFCAQIYFLLGYIKVLLHGKLPLIDPLVRKELKRQILALSIDLFKNVKTTYQLQNNIYSSADATLHPHHSVACKMLKELEDQQEELESHVASKERGQVRYKDVYQHINHGLSTIFSTEIIDNIKLSLDNLRSTNDLENVELSSAKGVLQVNQTLPNYQQFLKECRDKYVPHYPDIVWPIVSATSEFLHGLKLNMALLIKSVSDSKINSKINIANPDMELMKLVVLPSLYEGQNSYEKQIQSYTTKELNHFVRSVLSDEELPNVVKQENFRLLKCAIQESFNNCVLDARTSEMMNKQSFIKFCRLVDKFVHSWNKQQEEKEKADKEAETLYKTRTKCENKSDAEEIEDELKTLFPNFHATDFSDMQEKLDDLRMEDQSNEFSGIISYEDLKVVVNLHTTLLQNYTKTEWLNPKPNKNISCDFVSPLIEKYKVFKKVLDKKLDSFCDVLDKSLLPSLNVLRNVVENYGEYTGIQELTSPTRIVRKKDKNFYKDPDVDEVKSCYHILEELRLRIEELLNEWPDHPTLKTIKLIIERVYGFDIVSPVSRFLTGLEILLSKCHEWEQVAHSGVSLGQYSQNLTQQIITWRKLELSMWKNLLNQTFDNLNEPLSKWWLYLYNLLKQFILDKTVHEDELIEMLQNFIVKSSLVEFQGRLDLIHAFHCHATYLEMTNETKQFVSILWNLYCYFQQFEVVVENKIKNLKAPIEKKLKDYVKIVRWKDVNYWAIKDTVEKSHKTLHKFIREFKETLHQPVSTYLVNVSSIDNKNVGIWDRPQRHSPKTYHYTLDPDSYLIKYSLSKKESNTKLEADFGEFRKLSKEIIERTNYPSLVQALDGMVTEIVETSSHLQSLEVDTTLPKSKQKSQAKSILNQKHRALADLFKTLSKIGLSFRTGIVKSKVRKPADDFILKPIDVGANFAHISSGRLDEKILTIWESCEDFYYRTLIRSDVLETAMKNPAQDLGPQNLERCKGFATHFISFAQMQKTQLAEFNRRHYYMRYYLKQLQEWCKGGNYWTVETVDNIREYLKNVFVVMCQIKIILNSCPEEDKFGDEVFDVPLLETTTQRETVQFKNDANWNNAMRNVDECINLTNKLSSILKKTRGDIPCVDAELILHKFVIAPDIKQDLKLLQTSLANLKYLFINTNIGDSLNWLWEYNLDTSIYSQKKSTSKEEYNLTAENLRAKIMTTVEKLHDKYRDLLDRTQEDIDTESLQKGHLKSLLMENIMEDVEMLDTRKLLTCVEDMAYSSFSVSPQASESYQSTLAPCLPLLEQVIQLHQYFITQQVSTYRITCKLSSILLNIFIELVSKGFCVPPELAEEIDEEGVSKPSDGLGLGEGQGERDVSDKIESEDQLDDAQPAGQEKENQEDPDCKEEDKGIEMSEDIDSKLQDKKKNDDDDSDNESTHSDAEEQMGDTEKDADQIENELFGSDEEKEGEGEEESDQKEEKGDKGEKEGEEQLGAAEDKKSKENHNEKDDKTSEEEREKSKKDINELEEPEYDDEQTDPYHGKQPDLPEPEAMDLPDDLQLDEGDVKDPEEQEDNPFDIDTMKDQAATEDKPEEENTDEKEENDEENNFSSDDEEIAHKDDDDDDDNLDKSQNKEENKSEEIQDGGSEDNNDEDNKNDQSTFDENQTNQDNVEAMETDHAEAADKTQSNQSQNQKSNEPIDELCQEDKPDKEGVGQSQMEESQTGHAAQTSAPQEVCSSKREQEEDNTKRQKPGDSDSKRSLGDVSEPIKKKLKTIDASDNNDPEDNISEQKESAEIYQHIKEAKEQKATQVLDAATKEQAEKQTVPGEEEQDEETAEPSKDLPEEEEDMNVDDQEAPLDKSEKNANIKDKKKQQRQHPEGEILEDIQNIDIEGDLVQTSSVARPVETTHHTRYDDIRQMTAQRLTQLEINNLRREVEEQLASWNDPPSSGEAEQTWQKISSVTLPLAQDLSEQLRLVLEPTQASRLKGDFRTGRRINMRKVIPYIASQFRKDKIWLRRTKPSKREYQIVLAIDDSSSMADNRSKELAFESVALISKALTLLESGQLSVVSFGENVEVLHKLVDQFTDRSGVKLLQRFRFDQQKTCVAKLVDFTTEMFNQTHVQSSALIAKLLIIVSDGRGVFSEGETFVRQAVRRAKLSNIFMVFVIIDNPDNKNSVLDIRMPVFKNGKLLGIQTYMDVFPFSFYIILRDLNSLPSVLSDALRQWFEVVSNLDKQ